MAPSKSTPKHRPRVRPDGWLYTPRYVIPQWDEVYCGPPLTTEQRTIAPKAKYVFDVEVNQESQEEWSARIRRYMDGKLNDDDDDDDDESPAILDSDYGDESSSSFDHEDRSWPGSKGLLSTRKSNHANVPPLAAATQPTTIAFTPDHVFDVQMDTEFTEEEEEGQRLRKRARLDMKPEEDTKMPALEDTDNEDQRSSSGGNDDQRSSSGGNIVVGVMARPQGDGPPPPPPREDDSSSDRSSDGILEVFSSAKAHDEGMAPAHDDDDDDHNNDSDESSYGIVEVNSAAGYNDEVPAPGKDDHTDESSDGILEVWDGVSTGHG